MSDIYRFAVCAFWVTVARRIYCIMQTHVRSVPARYYFHLMTCAIIYCVTLQDDLLTTGADNITRAKHLSISLSCGQ